MLDTRPPYRIRVQFEEHPLFNRYAGAKFMSNACLLNIVPLTGLYSPVDGLASDYNIHEFIRFLSNSSRRPIATHIADNGAAHDAWRGRRNVFVLRKSRQGIVLIGDEARAQVSFMSHQLSPDG